MISHIHVSVALCSVAALCLHLSYKFYKARTWYKGLPQPPHSFLLGHLKEVGEISKAIPSNCHPQVIYTIIAKKYGFMDGIFYVDLWPVAPPFILLCEPELMSEIMTKKPLPIHEIAQGILDPSLGPNAIPSTNGSVWKRLHNALAPAFAWSHIRSLTPMIAEEAVVFRSILDQYAKTGETFSMMHAISNVTFDTITRIVFNYTVHAQTQGSQILSDFHAMVELTEAGFSMNPFLRFGAWLKRGTLKRRVANVVREKVAERFHLLKKEKTTPSRKDPYSILDLMLREYVQNSADTADIKAVIPEEEMALIVTNIKALLLGGHGTATDTLCFVHILLWKNQDALRKMREEHTRVFAESHDETLSILQQSPERLNALEYTTAVILETLRLFPVGMSPRMATAEGATLDWKGIKYPIDRNACIVPASHALHYNPTYYPEPTKFRPERFIDAETATAAKANMRTFGRGPRGCMGLNLAQDELRIILLMTVRDYDFEMVDFTPNKVPRTSFTDLDTIYGDVVYQELGIEARPRGKVYMKVTRRSTQVRDR